MSANDFTHFDADGNAVMVDISAKEITIRQATAKGEIYISGETLAAIQSGTNKKGDVLGVARIAGICAAKRTAELIPLCHPLMFDTCKIDFEITAEITAINEKSNEKIDEKNTEKNAQIQASCTVKLSGKTGVEMEALTGVSVALLTIYDMCKAIDKKMVIGNIRLCEKSGGRSGHFVNETN
jgi:cyclic pyranopterin phosphate synthase